MLFQTYYQIDVSSFQPSLARFASFGIHLEKERFSLYFDFVHSREEDREDELQLRTLHRCDDIPDDVAAVFQNPLGNSLRLRGGDGFSPYTPGYREFVLRIHRKIDVLATELFNLIRWRLGIDGGPLSLTSEWSSMRWHCGPFAECPFNEHGFLSHQVPAGVFSIGFPGSQCIKLCQSSVESIKDLSGGNVRQPLYHDLFREAWQNKSENPRSALVMAMAAAETAIKTSAVDLHESLGVEWVFENLPSPPLDRMLRDYVQLLPARRKINGEVRRPPKTAIKLIKEGVELRNKLVHGRGKEIEPDSLGRILCAVRDVLYLFDYYRGEEWALERCSAAFVEELKAAID